MGLCLSSPSDTNGSAPNAIHAPASGWLRSLRDILAHDAIPVWKAAMQVDETSSDVPPSPSSKASRKRPLSPPSSRPSQVSATSARNGDDTTRAQSVGSSAESSTQWHPGMSKKLLHLFAGPGGRTDGLRALARVLLRVDTVEIDTLIDEVNCDLLDDEVFADLMSRILAGEFFAAVIGTPCGTSQLLE